MIVKVITYGAGAIIALAVLAILGVSLWINWISRNRTRSHRTTTPQAHQHHNNVHVSWAVIWSVLRWLTLCGILVFGIIAYTSMPPPPVKIYGATEVTYSIKTLDHVGNIIPELSGPCAAINSQTLGYFEMVCPLRNVIIGPRRVFTQNFLKGDGEWIDTDYLGKPLPGGKHGFFHVFRNDEYVPNKMGTLRGEFWEKKGDKPFMMIVSPNVPTELRTVWRGL